DLLSVDFAASVDGWVADSALSVVVGTPRQEDLELIAATEEALERAIEVAQVGNKIGDIAAAIGAVATAHGWGVNTAFGGRGVGCPWRAVRHVPSAGRAGLGLPLRLGLVIAIVPWFVIGSDQIYTDPDGWTLRSVDGSRGAHSEHTVAITHEGPIV